MQCFIRIQEVFSHVQCSNDVCCVRFIYNKTSKQCIGVHHMENGVHSTQEITTLSNITQQYRKGNRNFRRHTIFAIRQNLRNKYGFNLFLTSTLRFDIHIITF